MESCTKYAQTHARMLVRDKSGIFCVPIARLNFLCGPNSRRSLYVRASGLSFNLAGVPTNRTCWPCFFFFLFLWHTWKPSALLFLAWHTFPNCSIISRLYHIKEQAWSPTQKQFPTAQHLEKASIRIFCMAASDKLKGHI